ncbi:hypothetical protein PCANC_26813 [Puccinia coronata f. sp. avenae]|uniref:Uncharacterized protein n=1 Tax=Puccinia coronata f. sp. avenae TaxID=200324 RepID=A0A2N5U8N5_9BASI|nr:hypothetical protein PCANC_26813 [Puccinia coronata f. sp. avenae]
MSFHHPSPAHGQKPSEFHQHGEGKPGPLLQGQQYVVERTTAGINWSNTAVRAVLEQPCSTGGPAGTGRTNLSNQLALASVGQCPSDHRSNTAVRAPLKQPCSTG